MPDDVKKWLLENGQVYIASVCPENVERYKIGLCYDATLMNAVDHTALQYVEGLACVSGSSEIIAHAWLTDGDNVFDPTWHANKGGVEVPVPAVYIGIPLATLDVALFVRETGYSGVMANAWRAPALARTILPPGFPIQKWF